MTNDRYRHDQKRYRDRDDEDDGYIARHGFGSQRSGYARTGERDFGDSAGYGSGGSTLDWRDVVGDDRSSGGPVFDTDRGSPRRGSSLASHRVQDRHGSSSFGRGSREYSEEPSFFERVGNEIGSWFGSDDSGARQDQGMGGRHHRGRGPKGYQRSDARILEDVNDRLTDDPHIDASDVEVTVSNREVTLNGTVNSRFEKRRAEDVVEAVSGVVHVQNNLRIQQYADAGMGGSMLSGAGAAGAGTSGVPDDDSTGGASHDGAARTRASRQRSLGS